MSACVCVCVCLVPSHTIIIYPINESYDEIDYPHICVKWVNQTGDWSTVHFSPFSLVCLPVLRLTVSLDVFPTPALIVLRIFIAWLLVCSARTHSMYHEGRECSLALSCKWFHHKWVLFATNRLWRVSLCSPAFGIFLYACFWTKQKNPKSILCGCCGGHPFRVCENQRRSSRSTFAASTNVSANALFTIEMCRI